MLRSLTATLDAMTPGRMFGLCLVASGLIAAAAAAAMSLAFNGRVTPDDLIAGGVAAMAAFAVIMPLILQHVRRLRTAEAALIQSKTRLQNSERELRSIIRTTPDIIYRLDRNGVITFINDAVGEYGYTAEELLGRDIMTLVHPEDRERAACRINERRTGDRKTSSLEIRLMTKEKKTVPFELKSKELADHGVFMIEAQGVYASEPPRSSHFTGTQGIARDISIRRYMEKTIRENEKRLSQILDSLQIGVVIIDAENQIIVDVNPMALKMIGAPREEIIGSVCYPYFCPAEKGKCPIIESGRDLDHAEGALVRYDGKVIPILKTAAQVAINGRTHVIESFLDVSAQKKAEDERENLIYELQNALAEVKTLSGLLPICASCKKIRDDTGYWNQIESYIHKHSMAEFSHSICPDCADKLYPGIRIYD